MSSCSSANRRQEAPGAHQARPRHGPRCPGRAGGLGDDQRRAAAADLDPAALGQGARPAATAEAATPKGATRLVIFGQEADFTIIDTAPVGDSPGDQILFTDTLLDQAGRRIGRDEARCTVMFGDDVLCDATFVIDGKGQLTIEGVGLNLAVTGGTGRFKKARGQLHETFLPPDRFRFAFTLYL